jgi:hypothetical protein
MDKLLQSIERFVSRNSAKILICIVVMVGLSFLEKFPYLNTFLSFPYPWNSLLILSIVIVVVFKLREEFFFGLAFALSLIAALLAIFGKDTIAQAIGNTIYCLVGAGLVLIIFQSLWNNRKT